jgi:hypothetical protein
MGGVVVAVTSGSEEEKGKKDEDIDAERVHERKDLYFYFTPSTKSVKP